MERPSTLTSGRPGGRVPGARPRCRRWAGRSRCSSRLGFQTQAFGEIVEPDQNFVTLFQGKIMTEAALQPVPIDDATRAEIAKIHEQCVSVNGPLSP